MIEAENSKVARKHKKKMSQVNCHYSPEIKCMLKVNNKNIEKRCEVCPKLTVKTPERSH